MYYKLNLSVIILILTIAASAAHAQEYRRIEPIPTPLTQEAVMAEGGIVRDDHIPVYREAVEQAMQAVAQSWNSPEMSRMLSDSFLNKDRLMDVMAVSAPMDASMRLVSVGSHRVLEQTMQDGTAGQELVSRVAVSARVQVEYNDPVNGFQRRLGEQEYIIKITQQWGTP